MNVAVASSGIASQLIPGGRTAHSRFCIPIKCNEESTCHIVQGSDLAELLIHTTLIIWDEAPMTHRFCFEALDRTLRDIMRFKDPDSLIKPFGGDFRQILPVIPRGSRQDIVLATLNASYIWSTCRVLNLTKNMRLQSGQSTEEIQSVGEFSQWLIDVGDGKIGCSLSDDQFEIDIPNDILLKDYKDPIKSIAESTYPDFSSKYQDHDYFRDKAILAPTLEDVSAVNQYLLDSMPGDEKIYLSSDSICRHDENADYMGEVYTTEFLNSINGSGLPYHQLRLKIGAPIMLLRNIDKSIGLCNGTRLVVTRMSQRVIEGVVLSGKAAGLKVLIARYVITPSDSKLPFSFQRRQFPVVLSFAMTINKSQGQSLASVGLYLPRPVFTHGQLYVALSRVRSRSGIKVLICNKSDDKVDKAINVVYREVYQNVR